jgi:hypothetical protein
VSAQHTQDQTNFTEHHQSEPGPAAVPPIADSNGARFELRATHAIDKHDGGIKVRDRMALDKRSVTYPDLSVSGAATYQCGNTILEYRVMHCGRKSRLDMCAGSGESRPAVDTDPFSRAPTPSEVSFSSTCRHKGTGMGAAPK